MLKKDSCETCDELRRQLDKMEKLADMLGTHLAQRTDQLEKVVEGYERRIALEQAQKKSQKESQLLQLFRQK